MSEPIFKSARIYYSGATYPSNYVDVPISRWDEGNWNVVIEFFLGSGNRNTLFKHAIPGAVAEMYTILGEPTYYDTTFSSSNTWIIEPISGYGLSSLRQTRTIAIKSLSDSFLNHELFTCKVEGYRL